LDYSTSDRVNGVDTDVGSVSKSCVQITAGPLFFSIQRRQTKN
jgi:hypothetical protein